MSVWIMQRSLARLPIWAIGVILVSCNAGHDIEPRGRFSFGLQGKA
jgi:hypothetical protein